MKVKAKIVISVLLLLALFFTKNLQALEDCDGITGDTASACWSRRAAELQKLISQSQGQQKTLSDAIDYLNNKMALTQTQIYQKGQELKVLEENINLLSVKIGQRDQDLTKTAILFQSRLTESYKRTYLKPVYLLLESGGLSSFLNSSKYLQVIQASDSNLLKQLQIDKNDLETQKTIKEEKQKEVEQVKADLAEQTATLQSQNQEKQRLLNDTKNDERKYQELLKQAQAQKAAFSRFVASLGGASILSGQTKCDDWGCYYNQRDGQWGNQTIGASDSSMAGYGCLVTSMAMIASHYGKSLTPGQIAASTSPFFGSTAYMLQGNWSAAGVTMNRTRLGSSLSIIDEELNAGRPVIVGIYGGPDHFLVIKGKEGGDYIMHDPFPAGGADLKFTAKYPLSAISSVDRVTVQ
ncbi:MAG: C39 family peptidase [Patescibacteria group bacterium]|nr:C39 family peptidase [Patescibacteria group bacterium]